MYRLFLLYRGFFFIAALTYLAIDLNILCRVNTAINEEVSSTLLVSPGCIGTTLSEARKKFKIYILFQESMQKLVGWLFWV